MGQTALVSCLPFIILPWENEVSVKHTKCTFGIYVVYSCQNDNCY